MIKLFKKELALNVKLPVYLLSLLGFLVAIPNYPIIVGMGYCVFQVFIYLQFVRENLSQEFSSTLPVRRRDIVYSTALVIVLVQMMTVTVGAIGGIVAKFAFPQGNMVGMDANFAFFGISFACLATFNAVFLPGYFKTGYKYGWPIVFGLIGFLLVYGACEVTIQIVPALRTALDTFDNATVLYRLIVLIAGIALYVVLTVLAAKRSVKKFEKVNL